jgi:hypothetical protein
MVKFVFARTLTAVLTAVVLASGVLSGGTAYAHGGMGGHMGGAGMGMGTNTLTNTTTNKVVDHDIRRRFRFVGINYTDPTSSSCFYKRSVRGLLKICPDWY